MAAPFTFKGGGFPGVGGSCGLTLAAGANCTIVVTYAPSASVYTLNTMRVDYDNGAVAAFTTRPMDGTGLTPALLTIDGGPTYDFGTQATGSTTTNMFTITNSGQAIATGVMDGAGLASPFDYDAPGIYPGGGSCVGTLGAGASCTIVIEYAPGTLGPHTDTLVIAYNNGASAQTATTGRMNGMAKMDRPRSIARFIF